MLTHLTLLQQTYRKLKWNFKKNFDKTLNFFDRRQKYYLHSIFLMEDLVIQNKH